jgi:hypothetical protein
MSFNISNEEREQFNILLMKAIDGELTPQEQEEFDAFLERDPACFEEWQKHRKLKEVTRSMKFKSPPPEVWDTYWQGVYNRLERGFAWILFSIGSVILLTYGGFKAVETIVADPNLATIVKIGLLLVIGGLAALFVSVAREKLFTFRKDPYKEIQR